MSILKSLGYGLALVPKPGRPFRVFVEGAGRHIGSRAGVPCTRLPRETKVF
jgi:hypothetical protein